MTDSTLPTCIRCRGPISPDDWRIAARKVDTGADGHPMTTDNASVHAVCPGGKLSITAPAVP